MSTTMLYRPAETPNPACWGLSVEHRVFPDADLTTAMADGWHRHPDHFTAEAAPEAASEPTRKGRPPKGA